MHDTLDHIIWGCDDLERGSRRFEALTGVAPVYGGIHAGGSTHNALVSLGDRCYLEILAPTGAGSANEDHWCRLARAAQEPRVLTYCLRSSRPLSEMASLAAASGWTNAVVASNGRTTPAGVALRWQWLAPRVDEFGLAFPFFIDWLDSPHPAESLRALHPSAHVRLASFAVGHPDAPELGRTLAKVGAALDTYVASGVEFRLLVDTPKGAVSL